MFAFKDTKVDQNTQKDIRCATVFFPAKKFKTEEIFPVPSLFSIPFEFHLKVLKSRTSSAQAI